MIHPRSKCMNQKGTSVGAPVMATFVITGLPGATGGVRIIRGGPRSPSDRIGVT
jgi:hypothetical protein